MKQKKIKPLFMGVIDEKYYGSIPVSRSFCAFYNVDISLKKVIIKLKEPPIYGWPFGLFIKK